MKTLLLDDERTWPVDVVNYLAGHYDVFLNWELGNGKTDARAYDQAIHDLRNMLRVDYTIREYHCARLTDSEIQHIVQTGMSLPSRDMLERRIQAIQQANLIDPHMSTYLITENQAGDSYRAGMIWFCFFPPHCAGQRGIERFFRSWGGEALYNSHEEDPLSGPILRTIGTPCIIEAYVPIASLADHGGLDFNIIRRFLVTRGFKTTERLDYEDRIQTPISAQHIARIIRYPEPDFIALTKCDRWHPPL